MAIYRRYNVVIIYKDKNFEKKGWYNTSRSAIFVAGMMMRTGVSKVVVEEYTTDGKFLRIIKEIK